MPSPIGHGLAGLAIGLAVEPAIVSQTAGRSLSRFAVAGAVVAAAPDADLIFSGLHRGISHSVGMTTILMIVTIAVTGWVTGRVQWRWVLLVGLAHASHIVMDWMGTDRYAPAGLEMFWPFSRDFYISGWDIFPPTERRVYLPHAFATNLRALLAEAGLMGPVAAAVFLAKRTRKNRVRTSSRDGLQRPSA